MTEPNRFEQSEDRGGKAIAYGQGSAQIGIRFLPCS